MTTFIDIIENASEELYDHLQKSSKRSFRGYEGEKALPRVPVPGELAYFLDDLIHRSGHYLDFTPEEAVADVIDLGIVTWYERLNGDSRARMGLPPTAHRFEDSTSKDKMLARLTQAQNELEGERTRLIAEIGRMRDEHTSESETIAKLRKEIADLKKGAPAPEAAPVAAPAVAPVAAPAAASAKFDEDGDDDDPDPAVAQAMIHAIETQNLGYTEMTAHVMTGQPGQGKKHQQRGSNGGNGQSASAGGKGRGGSGGSGKGGSRNGQARRRSSNNNNNHNHNHGRSQRSNRGGFSA